MIKSKTAIKIALLSLVMAVCCVLLCACGTNGGESKGEEPGNGLLTFTGLTLENYTCDYDGNEHEITVKGELPEGAEVEYKNNKATNSGIYNAEAKITCEGYKDLTLKATLTINKLNYDVSNIGWNYTSPFTYDGSPKSVEITGTLPDGVTIKEYHNNAKTNAGDYTATVEFNYDTLNHNAPAVSSCAWKIEKATYDMSNAKWDYESAFTYNGAEKTVSVVGLPAGVTVKSYSDNTKTDAGEYTASVILDYDTVNYNAVSIANLNWTINKADITGITFESKSFEYDTLSHSLEVIGNIPANSQVKVTYNGLEVSGVTEVGTYNAKLVITNANYNTYEATATLTIKSTEEQLYSAVLNGKVYFENNLDGNKLYVYDNGQLSKVNNDTPEYLIANGSNLYYYSSSLFSKVIKSYSGSKASTLVDASGEYLACDGTNIYYAVNNLLINTSRNGVYKVSLSGGEPTRLVQDKAEYLVCYGNYIYYANASDGHKLYRVSTSANDLTTGTQLFDEKVSYLIEDNGVLYFNSAKTTAGITTAKAIRKYDISSGANIKLTTDSGKYLTKIGSYIYYINNDLLTSNIFGDGIYRVSALLSSDSSLPGTKVLEATDNGYSSLSSDGNNLYYYKLNNKHIYSYNVTAESEVDLMSNFVVQEEQATPSGYAKIAEYNGEVYYTNPLDDGCVYKYNLASKTTYKVLSNSVSGVYFYRGYMYYSTYVATNYALFRMNLENNEATKISSSRCDNLIFEGDKIYYVKVGSAWNNHIMRMNLDGTEVETVYKDKSLWVASFEKVGDYLYFTINPSVGYKYVYRYNISTGEAENLNLRSNYMTVEGNTLYYYNIADDTLMAYNLADKTERTLVSSVEINNMIVVNGYLYYSSSKKTVGFYKYNLSTNQNTKISDKCADGMTAVGNNIYFIQTAISYSNDYPSQSNGNGKLYVYNGSTITAL